MFLTSGHLGVREFSDRLQRLGTICGKLTREPALHLPRTPGVA